MIAKWIRSWTLRSYVLARRDLFINVKSTGTLLFLINRASQVIDISLNSLFNVSKERTPRERNLIGEFYWTRFALKSWTLNADLSFVFSFIESERLIDIRRKFSFVSRPVFHADKFTIRRKRLRIRVSFFCFTFTHGTVCTERAEGGHFLRATFEPFSFENSWRAIYLPYTHLVQGRLVQFRRVNGD